MWLSYLKWDDDGINAVAPQILSEDTTAAPRGVVAPKQARREWCSP